MRKNRKDNTKKERIIMLASSAFVLTALTMTGIYMQSGEEKSQDDGYTLDFTALEENLESKNQEIARNNSGTGNTGKLPEVTSENLFDLEDDLDYMPLEAGSGNIEIPGVTTVQGEASLTEEKPSVDKGSDSGRKPEQSHASGKAARDKAEQEAAAPEQPAAEQSAGEAVVPEQPAVEQSLGEAVNPEQAAAQQEQAEPVITEPVADVWSGPELHFAASDGLLRPLEGEALIPFSMDGTVYFSTLDKYAYNPALMLASQEGTSILACAAGRVIDIFQDAEIGQAVTMDLGDGYQLTYGQLKGLNVALNSYVNPGDLIASVAAPTKYYCVEGANLYLKLTQNGTPVDPEVLFR